jgi:hypothetical protein
MNFFTDALNVRQQAKPAAKKAIGKQLNKFGVLKKACRAF